MELETVPQERTHYIAIELALERTYTFRVEAEDAEGNLSVNGPSLTAQISDTSPPIWSEGARLSTSDLTPNSVTLGWTPASDDVGVAEYVIRKDETSIENTEATVTEATVTWLTIDGLSPWTEYIFTVDARDAASNPTIAPLSATVFTPDYGVPSWGEDVALLVSDPEIDRITLSWSPASDDVEVTGYRVYQDLVLIAETEPDHRAWTALSLAQDETYSFSLQAVDAAGNESRDGPSLQVHLNDQNPPRWDTEAALAITQRTDTSIELSWPMAMDDVMVVAYALFVDEQLILTVDGETTSATVENLTPNTEYHLALVGSDAAGNITEPRLTLTVSTTADQTPPIWPTDATLLADDVGQSHIALSWTAARDAVGVDEYLVFEGEAEVGRTDRLSMQIDGLSPRTEYQFTVQARDALGHQSIDGPELSITTLPAPPMGPSTAEVYATLRPSCGPCHYPGSAPDTAYFISEMVFQQMVVDNLELVVPGDPDGSVLVQLLEGTAMGTFAQMPPGGETFATMAEAGNTGIAMEAIRQWITTL